MDEIFSVIEESFAAAFGLPLAIVIVDRGVPRIAHHSQGYQLTESDLAIALTTIAERRAGASAETALLPLTTWRGTFGALACPSRAARKKRQLLDCYASLTAVAILRTDLESQARYASVLYDADRFQKALLDSISHNVKTPTASILGILNTLDATDPVQRDLIETARGQAERLSRLLQNLLDLSRIEAGAVRVHAEHVDLQDVVGAAIEQLGTAAASRQILVNIASDVPFIVVDFVLMVQVLVNLLDNALKYSADDTPVSVTGRMLDHNLEITVSDNGSGIAREDLARVFEKFNRARRTGETGGVGLGLSICKALVEAHHGTIRAERRDPHGTEIRITLPHPGGG